MHQAAWLTRTPARLVALTGGAAGAMRSVQAPIRAGNDWESIV
jgi:hypothetical protein